MKTRIGKIAQLPKLIRDDLNQRLQNGKQGPELLKWLNALPETIAVLAEKFDSVPISKQNLSEWRQGGYQEWLRHQERELRIQRITEQGANFKRYEDRCDDDLFEQSGRIALAELMADMDSLCELSAEERSKTLHKLTVDLARLQNAYNHSRWAALAWTKWNDRFLGPDDCDYDDQDEDPQPDAQIEIRDQTPAAISPTVSANPLLDKVTDLRMSVDATKFHPLPEGEGRGEGERGAEKYATPLHQSQKPNKTPEVKPGHATSTTGEAPPAAREEQSGNSFDVQRSESCRAEVQRRRIDVQCSRPSEPEPDDRIYLTRPIHYHKTCGHVCRTCHPDDGKYPYNEALADSTEAKQRGVQAFWRGRTMINTAPIECSCPCDCNNAIAAPTPPKPPSIIPQNPVPQPKTPREIAQQNALNDFLRQVAHRKSLYLH